MSLTLIYRAVAFSIALGVANAGAAQSVAPGLPASAQRAQPPRPKNWTLGVGLAPVYAPVWQGSRDQALSIFPDLRVNYRDAVFFSVPDGLGWNMVNTGGWKLGPLFKFRFGRNESSGGSPFLLTGGSTALQGFGSVGFAGEPGAFAQYGFANGRARVRAELRHGFGGHQGIVADTLIGWNDRIGTPAKGLWLYGVGARASYGSGGYTNVYFGVDAAQAAATGLPVSPTGAGLVSAGVNASLTKPLGRTGQNGALTLFTGYDRLGGVVGQSALIRERGQRDQLSVGLAYGIRFSWD